MLYLVAQWLFVMTSNTLYQARRKCQTVGNKKPLINKGFLSIPPRYLAEVISVTLAQHLSVLTGFKFVDASNIPSKIPSTVKKYHSFDYCFWLAMRPKVQVIYRP